MGDRISISFENGIDESIVFFSHWDGKDLLKSVESYVKELKEDLTITNDIKNIKRPIDRLEPDIVIVDFIRWFTTGRGRIDDNYYLGATETDGDNSDNGHFIYDLKENKWNKSPINYNE